MIAGERTRRPPLHKMRLSSRRRLSRDVLAPAFGGQPIFPPALAFSTFALLLGAEFWSRLRYRPQRIKSHGRSQGVNVLGISQLPRPNETIPWIIHPLRAEALRASLLYRNPVFQKGGMPRRKFSRGSGGLQQGESHPLEFGFSDCMLRNEPRSLASVFTGDVLKRPAML